MADLIVGTQNGQVPLVPVALQSGCCGCAACDCCDCTDAAQSASTESWSCC